MTWIDVGEENLASGNTEAIVGVCFRSDCGGWNVAADDLRKPPHARRWAIWDMRHGQRRPALMGCSFPSSEAAVEAADTLRGSMGRRLSSGLSAVLRAHLRSLLGSVRAVLAAEVGR